MTGPPVLEQDQVDQRTQNRLCDFCSASTATLYCRADSAKLCLTCDREVHSTNQLFIKHTRSLLCDACDSSPASIFCSTHGSVFCQNCDWESHSLSLSPVHDRRPVEWFSGRPSVTDLLSIFGVDDLGKKGQGVVFDADGLVGYGSDDGLSDYLVWDTPSFASLDDLIACSGSEHNFQAMGVPPLPKNRNAVCGQHKEEILHQLRDMAKLEPNVDDGQGDSKALVELKPLVPEQTIQQTRNFVGIKQDEELSITPTYEVTKFQWYSDTGEVADQGPPYPNLGSYIETNCLVPDKDSDIGQGHMNGSNENESPHPVISEAFQVFPKVSARELTSQERETAISRYKEKKKSRRYDKHIRYESRKVRAESRTRVRGRFAKVDH
ncbi:hypothetical protein RJ639_000433 [Escallonia herrerae]|uniref:Zinc finger protein CONSTANS-LIKE 13 n=1 Tax=Escallonia herrerae TaxID=1293975 RepID=A0AA88X8D4_9ASTE|nr:hypothetical protein RJ639_000433 [Escallonia herrerae]